MYLKLLETEAEVLLHLGLGERSEEEDTKW
jgi:hypothetical protein